MLLNKLLLVGEPDGGGTIADPPETPEESVTQPEPEQPAPVEDAPAEVEGEPAEEPEASPESEDFTPEERRALLERLKDSDEFKEIIPKDEPKPAKSEHPLIARQDDPLFRAVAQDVGQSYERIDALARKLADPNAQIMQSEADAIAADLSMAGHFQALAERRGQLATITMIAMRELGVEGDAFNDANPLHQELEQAIADVESKMTHNYRQRGRLLKEIDPQKRQQMAQTIEESDAALVGGLLNNVIKLAGKQGETRGKDAAEKDFEKRGTKLVTLAKSNGNVEATAKAKRMLAGAVAQQSGQTQSRPASTGLTREEAETLPIDELIRRSKEQ